MILFFHLSFASLIVGIHVTSLGAFARVKIILKKSYTVINQKIYHAKLAKPAKKKIYYKII